VLVCFEQPFSLYSRAQSIDDFDDVTAGPAVKVAKLGPVWMP
jgi:hypothetical protein